MYSSIGKNLDAGVQTDIIFLDFSKAFDSVPHHLLLHKLQAFGFSSTLLNWLNHYLHRRSQSVIIERKVSPSLPVKSGVPQGSILGPLLFVLYVNDICEVCSSPISLYADDAKIYRRIITINDVLILQSDLDALFAWSQLWKLSFNIKKCLQLSICRSLKVSYVYMLDHNALERVDTINDLGVTVTSNLSWSKNIKSISAKANCLLGMIRRSISFDAPSPVKFQLYVSHIRSILEYCSPIWSPANVNDILLLERVQRHAKKYILNNYSDFSYAERCIKLSILPLCFRREIIDLLLFFKYLNSYVDCNFSSYFELVGSLHSLRSSSNGTLLKLPRVKTTALQSSYFYRLVRLWNSLPRDIREASSVFSFKKYINNLYFSRLANFNINERCTWRLACTCGFCRP